MTTPSDTPDVPAVEAEALPSGPLAREALKELQALVGQRQHA